MQKRVLNGSASECPPTPGVALVVKQALARLKVADEWNAPTRRTDTEAAALRLAARIVPGRVPAVIDSAAPMGYGATRSLERVAAAICQELVGSELSGVDKSQRRRPAAQPRP